MCLIQQEERPEAGSLLLVAALSPINLLLSNLDLQCELILDPKGSFKIRTNSQFSITGQISFKRSKKHTIIPAMTQRLPFKGQRFLETKYLLAEYLGGSPPQLQRALSSSCACRQGSLQLLCTNPGLVSLENILLVTPCIFPGTGMCR